MTLGERRREGEAATPLQARQVFFVVSLAAATIHSGMLHGWPAVLPRMQDDPSHILVTDWDVTWLVSLTSILGIIASLVSGFLVEGVGPRRLLVLAMTPALAMWLMMSLASYKALLYVGRATTAFFVYVSDALMQPLVAELSPVRIRGMTSTLPEVFASAGLLLAYTLAHLASWKVATASCGLILLPCIITAIFVPESPYWLVRRSRVEDARAALNRLIGLKDAANQELSAITSSPTCTQASVRDQFIELRKSQNYRPTLLVLSLFVLRELGGRSAIIAYSVYIFREAGVGLDAFSCTVLMGVVRLLFACVSAAILDRTGRRSLLIVTAVLCALSQGLGGLFLHLQVSGAPWLPLVALLVYMSAYSSGVGPIPWTLTGELLPSPVRSVAVSLITCTFNVTVFGVNAAFLKCTSYFGLGITLLTFCSANFLIAIIVWRWIPESGGITLQDLEHAFAPENTREKYSDMTPVQNGNKAQQVYSVDDSDVKVALTSSDNSAEESLIHSSEQTIIEKITC